MPHTIATNVRGMQHAYALWLHGLQGWRRAVYLYLVGAAMALTMAPAFWIWLLPFCLGTAWLAWHQATSLRKAFTSLWWFCWGYFMAGLYWIGIAVTTDWETFWWALPFPILALPAVLAALHAACALPLWRLMAKSSPVSSLIAFAAAWIFTEWLKLWFLTGLPWNLLGYALAFSPWLMQPAALGGVWLLSVLVLLASLGPWLGALAPQNHRLIWTGWGLATLSLVFTLGYSTWVLLRAPSWEDLTQNQPHVALIQPNVAQGVKQTTDDQRAAIEDMLRLTRAAFALAEAKRIDLRAAIWPEAAVPALLHRSPQLQTYLAEALPPHAYLITGSIRADQLADSSLRYYNGLDVLDAQGQERGFYNKRVLVPFGEYVPLRAWLPKLESLTGGLIDTSPGAGPVMLSLPGLPPFSPMICYEGVLPAFERGDIQAGTSAESPHSTGYWLLNITNDGWFGHSNGPYQHFAQQRLRAVEERKSLVRVSNPGISGGFDAYGRNQNKLGLGQRSFLITPIPRAINASPLFPRTGNILALIYSLTLFIASFFPHIITKSLPKRSK